MHLINVWCLCVLVVSVVRSEDAETKKCVIAEEEDTNKEGDGFCVSKENCASHSSSKTEKDEEEPGEKYTVGKQEEKSEHEDLQDETEVDEMKEDGEEKEDETNKEKESGDKKEEGPRKGEEERHLVKIEVLEEGKMCNRIKASNDDVVTVHLRGFKASDGSEFITTYNEDGSEGLSIPFRMGVGDSIKGLELGVIGMCIAELRRLAVPASLVRNGREEFKGDKIPRGEDLIFEVRLLGAVPNYHKGMPNVFKEMDTNGDGVIQRNEMYDSVVGDGEMFPRGAEIVDTLTDEQMVMADKNKDGVIQWEEFHLPKWDEL